MVSHREIGGTLGMVSLLIKPIYTLYSGYLLGTPRIYHPKGPPNIFPMSKVGMFKPSFSNKDSAKPSSGSTPAFYDLLVKNGKQKHPKTIHGKNMLVKMDSSTPIFRGENSKNIWVATTQL